MIESFARERSPIGERSSTPAENDVHCRRDQFRPMFIKLTKPANQHTGFPASQATATYSHPCEVVSPLSLVQGQVRQSSIMR
jgi:hypothetical protein